MKKLLPIIIGLLLLISVVGIADAAAEDVTIDETSQSSETTTTVVFKITHGYTVVIPSQISLSSSDGTGYDDIKVDVDTISANHYLNVVVSADIGYYNETSKAWVMKLDGHEETIEYYVGVGDTHNDHIDTDATESPLKPGEGVISVHADQKSPQEVNIHCKIPGFDSQNAVADYAGEYKGKLKFTVSIDATVKTTNQSFVFEGD